MKIQESTLMVLLLGTCSGVYYGAMEKMVIHKRCIMVARVKAAR